MTDLSRSDFRFTGWHMWAVIIAGACDASALNGAGILPKSPFFLR